MRVPRDLHPVAWWIWAVGLAVGASSTTNPILLGILIGAACLTVSTCRSDQPWARSFRLYLALAAVVVVVRVLFRILLGGDVPGEVILELPTIGLPAAVAGIDLLGPFTREELLAALYEGLRLATLLIAVGAANALANPKRLMKSLPPALYEIGTAMTVAICIVPQLADSARRVRAAQLLRGGPSGRFRRVRGLRRLLVPVLEDAFDRSLALAAGMDARGYGRVGDVDPRRRRTTGALMIVGLIGVCVGVYGLLDHTAPRLLTLPMLSAGLVAAGAGFLSAGGRVRRTRYRPDRWELPELLVATSGVVSGAGLWAVQRWQPLVADPGVLAPPTVSLGALVTALVAVAPVWCAPPPLRAVDPVPPRPRTATRSGRRWGPDDRAARHHLLLRRRRHAGAGRRRPHHRAGGADGAGRTHRRRQVHPARRGRRPGADLQRRHPARRRAVRRAQRDRPAGARARRRGRLRGAEPAVVVRHRHRRGGARVRDGAARPAAGHHAPPGGGDARPARHRRPAPPRPAHPLRRPAAAGGDRLGADRPPPPAGPRRADLRTGPDGRRGRAGHHHPAGARRRPLGPGRRAPAGAGGPVRGPDGVAHRRRRSGTAPGRGPGRGAPRRADRTTPGGARPARRLAAAAALGPRRPPARRDAQGAPGGGARARRTARDHPVVEVRRLAVTHGRTAALRDVDLTLSRARSPR